METFFDADDYARARVDTSIGAVGIGLDTQSPAVSNVLAKFEENWAMSCAPGASCAAIAPPPITLNFHVHGIMSLDWLVNQPGAIQSFDGAMGLANGPSMTVHAGGTTGLYGRICDSDGTCTQHDLAVTELADGNLSYDDTFSAEAIAFERFTGFAEIGLGSDPTANTSFFDFMDTLSYDIISNDPRFVFTSDLGRTSLTAETQPPQTGVPEPGTLGLAFTGLLGAVFVRRRKITPAI